MQSYRQSYNAHGLNIRVEYLKVCSRHSLTATDYNQVVEEIFAAWLGLIKVCLDMKLFDEAFSFLKKIHSLAISSSFLSTMKSIPECYGIFESLSTYFCLYGVNVAEVEIIKSFYQKFKEDFSSREEKLLAYNAEIL